MMASADLIKCCLDSIRNISDHIEDALIYLDAGCIEAFQFLGAYPLLLELGARAVCSLENICSLDTVVDWKSNLTQAKKVVVITSRLLSDSHRYILRCLSTHTAVLHCTVFTSISEIAHSAYIDSPLGPDAFHEYESLLIQDYEEIIRKHKTKEQSSPQHSEFIYPEESNLSARVALENEGWSPLTLGEGDTPYSEASPSGRNLGESHSMSSKEDIWPRLAVSVHHFPMVLCPLSPKIFVLPSEGTVAEACLSNQHEDSLSAGLPPISSGSPFDGEDTPSGAIFTAHFLYHLAAKMDLKLEIFSLGNLSKTIGKMLIDMSSLYDVGRRKRSAGLLLVDRTLDLITTCCHGDSLVDRIFSSLPRRDRKTLPSQAMQNKQGPSSVVRAPLDVQIPLGQYLVKEETLKDETSVMEAFEIFLRGWTSSESDSKATDFVNFSSIVHDKSSIHSDSGILSGSLVSTEHYQGTQYSEALLYRRTKDGTLLIKKWLEEILRREKLTVPMKSRSRNPTTAELQSMITSLSKDQSSLMRNKGIIQQAVASVLALSEPHSSRWDAFVGAEKILRVSATSEMSQSLSAQIRDLVHRSVLVSSHEQKILNRESSRGLLSFRDALLLAITGYILAGENFPSSGSGGPFSWEDEHFLKEAIIDAILEDPGAANLKFLHGLGKELEANFNKKKPDDMPKEDSSKQLAVDDFDDDQWGNWGDENADQNSEHVYDDMQLKLELHDRVDGLFKFFHKLCGLKRSNIISRDGLSGLETGFGGNPSEGKGLLFKILTMVLGKYDVPGLEYHSSTVGRLFKSGFGRFGLGQAKPSLGDQNVILIFVVGGINGHEVIEVQEALLENGREDIELILGGTTLLTADDMLELLLGSSSHV
ncbi:hypothetical protein AQUCO_02900006v1 [Aquilegia coerulea]|uniref:Sec1 family domain-containing protein MIP3 n=1 Tax=Aquilegia coerulea TaxID=218851 RepID=A0A2G5D2W8_AQUCA|nr:hypothetical protein AQUCO_02900006v1 [Aquilegia coerulea]PIA37862.1 hypothetical protein AQUCO_02900006v1 [Aquilegia coerulea]